MTRVGNARIPADPCNSELNESLACEDWKMTKKVRQTDELPDGSSLEWPRPVYDREWTDARGTTWRMRGGELHGRAARRMVRRSDVVVLHAYGLDVVIVEGDEKSALLDRVEDYLRGKAPEYSVFELADFRDSDRNVMLAVQESC